MTAFYNEIDPYAAAWLRNLIKAGLIPDGEVSTHSIVDLRPSDLSGFDQCHFFAGIGGWSQALHLAGWAPDRPVWTGSCPCQPFSVAGKGAGTDDPRHLWPHFHRLIAACRPPVVLGEQVAGKAGYGWFDGVRTDLEATGYAGRAVDIPALAVNAPHIRQRLYWVATDLENASHHRTGGDAGASGDGGRSALDTGPESLRQTHGQGGTGGPNARSVGHMADPYEGGRGRRAWDGDGERDGQAGERHEDHRVAAGGSEDRLDVADAECGGRQSRAISKSQSPIVVSPEISAGSFWSDHIWLTGSDGKARRAQSGLPLLAHGVPGRVGKLRAYGNAIVPPLAAEVVKALMETLNEA